MENDLCMGIKLKIFIPYKCHYLLSHSFAITTKCYNLLRYLLHINVANKNYETKYLSPFAHFISPHLHLQKH